MKRFIILILCASISIIVTGCALLNTEYYAAYTATCTPQTDAELRKKIYAISSSVSKELGLATIIDDDDRYGVGVTINLPVIEGLHYRSDASGHVIFRMDSTNNYLKNQIGIVIIKVPKQEDDLARKIRSIIERELIKSGCSHWILDRVHTIYM